MTVDPTAKPNTRTEPQTAESRGWLEGRDRCAGCGEALRPGRDICSACGLVIARPITPIRLVDQRWPVMIVSFGILGPLGIPLVWYSRAFSKKEKVLLSCGLIVYTTVLVGAAVASWWWAWNQYRELVSA